MKFVLKAFILAAVVLSWTAVDAYACSCAGRPPTCEAYWSASAVFIGKITDVSRMPARQIDLSDHTRTVRLALEEAFRGVEGPEVEVLTGWGGGDCGYGFVEGERYLVYAYRNEKDKKLSTGICTRTRPLSEANEDLAYIRGLTASQPGSMIYGEVQKVNHDSDGRQPPLSMGGVRIIIEGQDKTLETVTDSAGQYRVTGLLPGSYLVKIMPPEGMAAHPTERKVWLEDRGCALVTFWVQANARLGREKDRRPFLLMDQWTAQIINLR